MPIFVSIKSASAPLTEEQLKEIFKQHDADGDGKLSKEELKKAFAFLGSQNPNWRVWRALSHADGNKDGCINLEELDQVVKYAAKLGYSIS